MLPAIDCANDMTRLWWRVAVLLEDANCVVAMRIMGLSGVWSVPPGESHDMIREKMPAFTEGFVAGALTAWKGRGPDRVLLAVVGPISAKARANRSRLARRGPRLPASQIFAADFATDFASAFAFSIANDDDLTSQNGVTAQ